ncbi:EF-hand_protein [Hexamita inflata]|uniref:EF-hand protein n=1 Tax=Hexamita inflata TaxID=28002 RepID=A0AA86QA92_9EUKA|nr:EF-hand protein [Hexamita inflata]CAI9938865.1 EF-hand protein [Hexamita inflata]CAI9948615.1 EF-hand protein [Hexamita inflata]CAI9949219.1 EF-hand protein [Hexamita inflata]
MSQILKSYSYSIKQNQAEKLSKLFENADRDQSGFVNYIDAASIFNEFFAVSIETCRLLFRLFQQHQIDHEQLEQLLTFLLCCDQIFERCQSDTISVIDVQEALLELYLNLSQELIHKAIMKFCQADLVNKTEFFEICSVCLLARKLFSEWDNQDKGVIEVGLEQVIEIGMLFM